MQVKGFLQDLVTASRAEPGCVSYSITDIAPSDGDKGGWEFVEVFKDKEAQDAHGPNFGAFMAKVNTDYMRFFYREQKKLLDTTQTGKPPSFESARVVLLILTP